MELNALLTISFQIYSTNSPCVDFPSCPRDIDAIGQESHFRHVYSAFAMSIVLMPYMCRNFRSAIHLKCSRGVRIKPPFASGVGY